MILHQCPIRLSIFSQGFENVRKTFFPLAFAKSDEVVLHQNLSKVANEPKVPFEFKRERTQGLHYTLSHSRHCISLDSSV